MCAKVFFYHIKVSFLIDAYIMKRRADIVCMWDVNIFMLFTHK